MRVIGNTVESRIDNPAKTLRRHDSDWISGQDHQSRPTASSRRCIHNLQHDYRGMAASAHMGCTDMRSLNGDASSSKHDEAATLVCSISDGSQVSNSHSM